MDVDVEESALKRNNTFRQYLRHVIRVPLHQFISLGEKNAALDDSLVYTQCICSESLTLWRYLA